MNQVPPNVPVQPLASLSPFMGNRWWIKARVVDKSDMRTWSKPQSSGKLFSFTLVDESCSMRATMFNETAEAHFSTLVPNQVYYMTGGSVKTANKRFNNVNNDYEVTFDRECQVHVARDNTSSIPLQRYNFIPVSVLANREAQSMVDVLAVVSKVGDVQSIVPRQGPNAGTTLHKRTITLADSSAAIDFTVWEGTATGWSFPPGSTISIRNARVSSFDGVGLSASPATTVDAAPPIAEARQLSDWFAATGGRDVSSLSERGGGGNIDTNDSSYRGRKYFDDIQAEGLGRGIKPDYIDVRCAPIFIKLDSLWYDACPTCHKKVTPTPVDPNSFRCEKCDRTIAHPEARYLCSMQASDGVGTQWLTLFTEAAATFFGCTATELKQRSLDDPNYLAREAQQRLQTPMLMRIRVKEERSGDGEERVRLTVIGMSDFMNPTQSQDAKPKTTIKAEMEELLKAIAAY